MTFAGATGLAARTVRSDQELLHAAFTDELARFAEAIRGGTGAPVTGEDASTALDLVPDGR